MIPPMMTSVGVLSAVKQAATQLQLLSITYVDGKGVASIRTVEPYEIKNGDSLYAHCTSKNSIRNFKLNQITHATVLPDPFIPRFPIQI